MRKLTCIFLVKLPRKRVFLAVHVEYGKIIDEESCKMIEILADAFTSVAALGRLD